MLADFFDTMGTVVGVGAEAGLLDEEGRPARRRPRCCSSTRLAAMAGGAASASSATTYIESAAGVGDGARTGLASVVTGGLFLLALLFTPLVAIVPVRGRLAGARHRRLPAASRRCATSTSTDYTIAIPAFLTIVLMPFTYSITNGIGAGFVSYALLKATQGRAREVHPLLWVVAALFVVYFAIDPLQDALTG